MSVVFYMSWGVYVQLSSLGKGKKMFVKTRAVVADVEPDSVGVSDVLQGNLTAGVSDVLQGNLIAGVSAVLPRQPDCWSVSCVTKV